MKSSAQWTNTMLWRDVIIGEGEIGNSAIKVFDLPDNHHHHVSHNQNTYWVSSCILDFGITIFKYTSEGQEFTKMIKEQKPLEEIQEWLDSLIIKYISSRTLHNAINQSLEKSFQDGKRSAKDELVRWLNG